MTTPRLTFFCELDGHGLKSLFSEPGLIPCLSRLGAYISLGIVDFEPERAEVVRRLNRAGVPVVAWQLLPTDEGYWYHMCNAEEAIQRYRAFIRWTREETLRWSGIGIDMEPDIEEFQLLLRHKWRIPGRLLRRGCGKKRLMEAKTLYQALIRQMQQDGYRVDSYEFPFMVDERWAGSTFLQRLTGIVDIPADRRLTMLYTSFFRPIGTAVLAEYARDTTAVGVGITGGGVTLDGIRAPDPLCWDELSRDLLLAARHADEIHLFSLEGCVAQDFLDRLETFDWQHQIRPLYFSRAIVRVARVALRTLLWTSARLLPISLLLAAVCSWMLYQGRS